MFGLSTKKVLSNAILNACKNKLPDYKKIILDNIFLLEGRSEEDCEQIFKLMRREYLDSVANSVVESFQISSPVIASKIQLVLLRPDMCGYEGIDLDNGLMAGELFAICFYAMKNSTAKPKDCIRLNHLQNDLMDRVLAEVNAEMS